MKNKNKTLWFVLWTAAGTYWYAVHVYNVIAFFCSTFWTAIVNKNKFLILIIGWAIVSQLIFALGGYASSEFNIHDDAPEFNHLPEIQDVPFEDLSVVQKIIVIAREYNFRNISMLLSLAKGESTYCKNMYNVNHHASGLISVDRGCFGINDHWHKEVSDECAFDLKCSQIATMNIIKQDGNCHQWMTCPKDNWDY